MEVVPIVKLNWPDLTFGAVHLPTMPKLPLYPFITHVAIKYRGKLYSLPQPNRHHHVIGLIGGISAPDKQGFLDNTGRFLDRKQALKLAKLNGQLIRGTSGYQGNELFSEDLW